MRKLQAAFGILIFITIGSVVWKLNLHHSNSNDNGSYFLLQHESIGDGNHYKCRAKTAVFFLKTHKCGSSTIQNILMRFGKHNNLNFVLPDVQNYIGNPEHFSPEFIGSKLRIPNGQKYDIFTHHTRYSHDEIRGIMKEGAPFVTIMRDPVQLQISLYDYYQMQYFNGFSLPDFMHINLTVLQHWQRFYFRVGWNQISWDLGVKQSEMNMPGMFMQLVNKMENEFDLVMITEFMEASLVLFADLMCWPLEEVRFISVNTRYFDGNIRRNNSVFTKEELSVLKKLNSLDIQLYSHFRQRFKQQILAYGADRMLSDVKRLTDMNIKLYHECVARVRPPRRTEIQVTQHELQPNAPSICKEILLPELNFTDIIRKYQEKRIQVVTHLNEFLNT